MSGMGRGRGRAKIGQMLNEQKPGGDSKVNMLFKFSSFSQGRKAFGLGDDEGNSVSGLMHPDNLTFKRIIYSELTSLKI